ncbi:hypothetical protein N9B48_00880 [bacterium]|nr:hypothetical protein [bacterium]
MRQSEEKTKTRADLVERFETVFNFFKGNLSDTTRGRLSDTTRGRKTINSLGPNDERNSNGTLDDLTILKI